MSRIFLSHSDKDDLAASALGGWLKSLGFQEIVADPAPVGDTPACELLARSAAALFLVSRDWLASSGRRGAFEEARKLKKRIAIALIDDLTPGELPPDMRAAGGAIPLAANGDRLIFRVGGGGVRPEDEVGFSEAGLARLKAVLDNAVSPKRGFAAFDFKRVGMAGATCLAALVGVAAAYWWEAAENARFDAEAAKKVEQGGGETAGGLVFDIAQKFRSAPGQQSLIAGIAGRAHKAPESAQEEAGDSRNAQRGQAAALMETADQRLAKGDGEGALRAARQAVAILQTLSASDPDNKDWRQDLSFGVERVAEVQAALGELTAALRSYRDSLAIHETLAAADPGNAEWRRDVALCHERIAGVEVALGDFSQFVFRPCGHRESSRPILIAS